MKPKAMAGVIVALIAVTLAVLAIKSSKSFFYAGTIEATQVDLSSRVNAVIDKVMFQEGDAVKSGDALILLSAEDIQVAYDQALREYKRAQQLLNAGSMNNEAFDRLRFKMEDMRVRLGWCTISAPLNGTVITKFHEPGELVAPGTKLLELADLSTVWAYIYVPQPMLSKIKLNMNVDAFIPESGMKRITGRIVKINDEAEFTPKNVQTRKERTRLVYGIKVEFNNEGGFLKPGMTVEMKLPKE